MKPGYKQTEVGVIPEDWSVTALGDACSIFGRIGFRGYTVDDIVKPGKGAIAFSPSNIRQHSLNFDDLTYISFAKYEESPEIKIENGDILLVKTGSTFGKTALVRNLTEKATLNPQIVVLKKVKADNVFLAYVMSHDAIQTQISAAIVGGAIPTLSQRLIANFTFPAPPLPEQRAIAKGLSDVDELIGALDTLIAKKRDLKQAAMQQLLTAQTRLPGFSGEWRKTTLGALGTFLKGAGVKKDEAASGDLPCVRYGEIYTHHHDIVRSFNSHISVCVAAQATRLRAGDVLFAGSGETKEEIGKAVAYLDEGEAYAGGDIVILRPIATDSEFLGYYLNSAKVQAQKASRGQGDAVVHISAASLASIPINIPEDRAEQTAIATALSDMDAELAALEARREKTRALKQGMLQQLLTGQIRLV